MTTTIRRRVSASLVAATVGTGLRLGAAGPAQAAPAQCDLMASRIRSAEMAASMAWSLAYGYQDVGNNSMAMAYGRIAIRNENLAESLSEQAQAMGC